MGELAKELEKDLPNVRAYYDTMTRHQAWFVDEATHAARHLKKSGIVDEDDEARMVEVLEWITDAQDAAQDTLTTLKNIRRRIIRKIEERHTEREEQQ